MVAHEHPRQVTLECRHPLGPGRRCEHRVTLPAYYAPVRGTRPRRYQRTVQGACPDGHPIVDIREQHVAGRGSVRTVSGGLPGSARR